MIESTTLGNPVTSLQMMLRSLKETYDFIPSVPVDGVFGEETLEAVLLFQRELHPPVTGVVNQAVWEAIREESLKQAPTIIKPRVLRAFPEGEDLLDFGDERAEIALFQMMFQLLSDKVAEIVDDNPSGIFTDALHKNVTWLQNISGLTGTGQLDRETWDRLARLYEVYITGNFTVS